MSEAAERAAAEAKAKAEAEAKVAAEAKAEAEAQAKAKAEAEATITVRGARVTSNSVVLNVVTTAPGTVTISGPGLKRTVRTLPAGTNQVVVRLTARGKAMRRAQRRIKVSASLTLTNRTATGSRSVKP
jgi:hypothetical protein